MWTAQPMEYWIESAWHTKNRHSAHRARPGLGPASTVGGICTVTGDTVPALLPSARSQLPVYSLSQRDFRAPAERNLVHRVSGSVSRKRRALCRAPLLRRLE